MRQIFLFISLAVLGFGLYLIYFYDVPDAQVTINNFTGWFMIIIGVGSILVNLFWSKPKNTKPKD